MLRLHTWTAICLLLFVARGGARSIINDFASVPISPSIAAETDDEEIDKILISADIRVSHGKEPPEATWPSSGEVDRDEHRIRNDRFQVPDTALSPERVNPSLPIEKKFETRSNSETLEMPKAEVPDDVVAQMEPDSTTTPSALLGKESTKGRFPTTNVSSTTLPLNDTNGTRMPTDVNDGDQALVNKGDSNVPPPEGDDNADDDTDSPTEVNKEKLPTALQNLPRDIPNDRTISEILAENMVQDKQYDEMRIEELIDELMAHTLGFGEVYSSDTE